MNWPDSSTSGGESPRIIITDEDYKARVRAEKQQAAGSAASGSAAGAQGVGPGSSPTESSAAHAAYAESSTAGATGAGRGQEPDLPPASFPLLVEMLATQAMMALGLMIPPGSQQPEVQLPLARHLIDLLGVLEAKCRGNLGPDEQQMLDQVLHGLRMAFVEIRQQK